MGRSGVGLCDARCTRSAPKGAAGYSTGTRGCQGVLNEYPCGHRTGRWGYSGYLAVGATSAGAAAQPMRMVCVPQPRRRSRRRRWCRPHSRRRVRTAQAHCFTRVPSTHPTTMLPCTAPALQPGCGGVCRSHAHARADDVIADVRADDDGADHTHAVGCARHRQTVAQAFHPRIQPPPPPHTHTHTHARTQNARKHTHKYTFEKRTHIFTQGRWRAHMHACTDANTHTHTQKWTRTHSRTQKHTHTRMHAHICIPLAAPDAHSCSMRLHPHPTCLGGMCDS